MQVSAIQLALTEFGFDGWLLCDFRGSNVLARRIVELDDKPVTSRRWYYWIPAKGEPRKLVHRIETGVLDHLPGEKLVYLRWQELEQNLAELVRGSRRIAMEYSPRNANPYVSRVDAGTLEVVKSFVKDVASSGDLVQVFEAAWDDDQWAMHLEAARHTDSAFAHAWRFIADRIRARTPVTERDVQQAIMAHFEAHGLTTYSPPIVAVGPHAGDPHYETGTEPLHENDLVLVDLWAKLKQPRAVYSDLTRIGFIGLNVPEHFERVFQIVAHARDAAIDRVRRAFNKGELLCGWQVDDAARHVIDQAGYGEAYVHRTGHNIGQEVHGNGANMDNLETHETRRVLRRTCFSIEPGIYLKEFGIRSEVDVFIDGEGEVHVTGGELQRHILPILAAY